MIMYAAACCLLIAFVSRVSVAGATPQQKPNFIIFITDDQGWDDMGLHNPRYVNTPVLDKFIRRSTFFDNFYVAPQCAQTRAALLTGRSYPRTGTVLVNGGYDFISRDEATAGQVMSEAGYQAVHFGKWHNKQSLGYEPWNVGFESGQVPMATSGLVAVNGSYEEEGGQQGNEDGRMTQLLQFLKNKSAAAGAAAGAAGERNATLDQKPFFVYYATNAIHVVRSNTESSKISKARVYPASYRNKYHNNPKYAGINHDTLDAWAMLEYLDAQLGRLIEFLEASGLRRNTYIMILSDNGSALMPQEDRKLRMPSGMSGNKSTVFEGGVRNFLAVQGPGVQPSAIDSTLLDVTDLLPTITDLAGITATKVNHKPWDGISFKNLLAPGSSSSNSSNTATTGWRVRGTSLASKRQNNRFIVILGPQCWDPNTVLVLGNFSRQVLRPQPLLNYEAGGMRNSIHGKEMPPLSGSQRGFQACLAVRHKTFKWIGATNKVYRFANGSHLEGPSTEVPEPYASEMAALLSSAAKSWWESIIAEPNSFAKPTFYLGLGNWTATNVLAMGAHEKTEGSITLLAMGATGFKNVGDRMCFKLKVLTAGQYDVIAMYTSSTPATFRLSVGPFPSIMARTAPSITTQLPALGKLQGMSMGSFNLPTSSPNTTTEACLELVDSNARGTAVFKNLANLRFVRRTDMGVYQDMLIAEVKVPRSSGSSSSNRSTSSRLQPTSPAAAVPAAPGTAAAGSATIATPAQEPDMPGAATTGAVQGKPSNSAAKPVSNFADRFNRQTPPTHTSSSRPGAAQPANKQNRGSNRVASGGVARVVGPSNTKPGSRRMQPGRIAAPRQVAWLPGRRAESAMQHAVHPGSSVSSSNPGSSSTELSSNWEALRQKYLLVDGQGVMESLFSPYETEGIDGCTECQPAL